MLRNSILFLFVSILVGCTNLDERHVFNYKIEGTATSVDDMHVVMGPGLDWTSGKEVELPVDISHDIYGSELKYVFEAFHSDPNADITLKVYIDEKLIEEKSEFEAVDGTNRIRISGVFIGD